MIKTTDTMKKRSVLFRLLELQTGQMKDGTWYARYYDCGDAFAWHYAKDASETEEDVIKKLDEMLDEAYPYTLYELEDNGRKYRSTDVTEIQEMAIKLERLGEVNDISRVSWKVALQRQNAY